MQDIIPTIQRTAYNNNAEVPDVHSLLINRPELFPDNPPPAKLSNNLDCKIVKG